MGGKGMGALCQSLGLFYVLDNIVWGEGIRYKSGYRTLSGIMSCAKF